MTTMAKTSLLPPTLTCSFPSAPLQEPQTGPGLHPRLPERLTELGICFSETPLQRGPSARESNPWQGEAKGPGPEKGESSTCFHR